MTTLHCRIRASGNIRNLKVEGLMWYVIDNVDINAIRLVMNVEITIPRIVVTGK
jgi:hypothetical protein